MRIIAVGFRVDRRKSVYYSQKNIVAVPKSGFKDDILKEFAAEIKEAVGESLLQAYAKGSQFVSVRFIE